MTACIAVMMLQSYKFNHFCDGYDTSNNHTIRAPNELVGGGTTSQETFKGAMCFTGAISAVCLVFMTGLIQSVHAIGSRYVYLGLYFFILVPHLYHYLIGFDVKIVVQIVVQNGCNCYCIVSKLYFSFKSCVTLVS
jgi:hypothetical protein